MREALSWACGELARGGVEEAAREARRLLALAVGEGPAAWSPSATLSRYFLGRLRRLVEARKRGMPFALLAGWTGFLDFELKVWPGVFIPRPETEELAELACGLLRELPPRPRVLDLGTGTGALACALARARSDAQVVAVDCDPRALACARWNVRNLGLDERIRLQRSHWFSSLEGEFQLIVSNPPYVAREGLARLPREVREFEPRRALDGGPQGLEAAKSILAQAPRFLSSGGWLLLEIAPGQAEALVTFAKGGVGLVETRVEKDMAGKERFFLGRCK